MNVFEIFGVIFFALNVGFVLMRENAVRPINGAIAAAIFYVSLENWLR